MSNINLTVGVSGLLDTNSNPITVLNQGSFNILLSPFYAMEQDVLGVFLEEQDNYISGIRKTIFEGSIRVDGFLNPTVQESLQLSDEEAFRLKREYVICFSVYNFSKVFYRDYLTSIKKSKFLADLKVSMEIERDPQFIKMISHDAKDCMEELEAMFGIGSGFSSFVKGRSNSCNSTSNRSWYPGIGSGYPRVPIAATKASVFCKEYKIGVN
jgi:hypothetical protein